MSNSFTNVEFINEAIRREVTARTAVIAEEEIAKAQEAVTQRVRQEVDRLALNLVRHYDVSQRGEVLTITVRKEI